MIKNLSLIFCVISFINAASGEITKEDYQRADSTKHLSELVFNTVESPVWVDSTYYLLYKKRTGKGEEYMLADAIKKEKQPAFNQEKLCSTLNNFFDTLFNPYSLPVKNVNFNKGLSELKFELDKSMYHYNVNTDSLWSTEKIPVNDWGYWGNEANELGNNPVKSTDSTWVVGIEKFNVVLKSRKKNKSFKLTSDGNEKVYYSSNLIWSPDSKFLITTKIIENPKKYLEVVESSPKDGFLPVLHKYEYLRPGDSLRIALPVLFDIENKREIPIQTDEYLDQFTLSNLKWWDNSQAFTFEYNRRGHQCYQVVRVDANTGNKTVVINETSNTFIDYSGKKYRYDFDGGKKMIWASERNGWNHLYLIDAVSGEVVNQITRGDWVVRGVEYVDTVNKKIVFRASGVQKGIDPYFKQFFIIDFKGNNMKALTPVEYNHRILFSWDHQYYLDTYSAANFPPVSIFKNIENQDISIEIEKTDISQLLNNGFQMPEPFMAMGRDGKTEIWGNIYRPVNVDNTKNYPVIEYIYAGPHSSFVQKWFYANNYFASALCELGFIVVQIDGMGTSNRSKAFQDVCYKNLKDAGFEDRIRWIKTAALQYPYMDISKVGIYGASAGGQSSTGALLFHPEFYKVAVSSCGCHDNRLDKIWWNEQWMGYPMDTSYAACSNIENAARLKGDLMLIVGEMDNNVDPASTYGLANELIKAGKEFELVVLPGSNHTLGGEFGERKRRDFFVKHILGENPPFWNE